MTWYTSRPRSQYRSAVVIEYEEKGEDPPLLSARADGEEADLIVRLARKHNVPVVSRPKLARALLVVDEGTFVPGHLFRAIAILFHEVEKLLNPR